MKPDFRLDDHPLFKFDRNKVIGFYFNGRKMQGYEGDTVASALYANGVLILSRSFKYHRPRGISCNSGHCSNCLMRVNGEPNVRTCSTKLLPNMKIESQNAWPSLKFDVASIAGHMDFLLRPGFQYKRFIRPRWLYHIWERFLRNRAGIGEISNKYLHEKSKLYTCKPEILVIGSGIAGISAAINAARAGAKVLIIEKEGELGGSLRFQAEKIRVPEIDFENRAYKLVSILVKKLNSFENCQVYTNSTVFGWYAEDIIGMVRANELWEIDSRCAIVTTGSYEYPMVFNNNDLPGIFLSGGLLRLIHKDGIKPGRNAIVITNNDYGYLIAQQIMDAGISVKAICDCRRDTECDIYTKSKHFQETETSLFSNCEIISALGKRQVKGISFSFVNEGKRCSIELACDFICTCNSRSPANDIIFQRNYKGSYVLEPSNKDGKVIANENMEIGDHFFAAGEASGVIGQTRLAYLQGKIAGLSAAFSLNYEDAELLKERKAAKSILKNI